MPCSMRESVIFQKECKGLWSTCISCTSRHTSKPQPERTLRARGKFAIPWIDFNHWEAATLYLISCWHAFVTNNPLYLTRLLQDLKFHTQI